MNFLELLIVALAVILGSLIKGTTGFGLPLTAVPVIAFFVGVQDAVVIMAAPTAVSNAMLVREYRRELRFVQGLPSFVGLGAIGAVAGAWLLPRINDRLLFLLLALLLSSFLAWRFSSANPRWSPRVQKFGRIPVAVYIFVTSSVDKLVGSSSLLTKAIKLALGKPLSCLSFKSFLIRVLFVVLVMDTGKPSSLNTPSISFFSSFPVIFLVIL